MTELQRFDACMEYKSADRPRDRRPSTPTCAATSQRWGDAVAPGGARDRLLTLGEYES
jgi:hypothetical protein